MGTRILQMIVLGFAFWVVCWIVIVTTLLQLVLRLVMDKPNEDITRFGASLARYAAQVIAYLTFASETGPFPFTTWPDMPTGVTKDDLEGL